MLKKETFVEVIQNIKKEDIVNHEFGLALDKVTDGHLIFTGAGYLEKSVLLMLKEIFNDKADYIEWWLYEDVEKVVWEQDTNGNKIEIDLRTIEQLYDFLIKNKDQ